MGRTKFFFGLTITIIGIFNLVVVVFAYRDFNPQLFVMFLIALLVYPYGIYLTIKHRPKFEQDSKVDENIEQKEYESMSGLVEEFGEEQEQEDIDIVFNSLKKK